MREQRARIRFAYCGGKADMMRLSREVRFAITENHMATISNSWSGWPTTNLVVPRLSLVTTVEGNIDMRSSYICNIKRIDDLVRNVLTRDVIPGFEHGASAEAISQSHLRI